MKTDLLNLIYRCAALLTYTANSLKYKILREDDLKMKLQSTIDLLEKEFVMKKETNEGMKRRD